MSGFERDGSDEAQARLQEAFERGEREADPEEVAEADRRLEDLLDKVADPPVSQSEPTAAPSEGTVSGPLTGVAMRTARPLSVHARQVQLDVRGRTVQAELDEGVSAELVAQAARQGDRVVVECEPDEVPRVVGVLQTRLPDEVVIKARKVTLEGEQEVLLRSGRGAVRIRQDGDVELVGSRISAMSRGLFRLVGRVLRLN